MFEVRVVEHLQPVDAQGGRGRSSQGSRQVVHVRGPRGGASATRGCAGRPGAELAGLPPGGTCSRSAWWSICNPWMRRAAGGGARRAPARWYMFEVRVVEHLQPVDAQG